MPHFFINSKDVIDNKVIISDKDTFNHLAKSLRVRRNEKLLLIDEKQIQYEEKQNELYENELEW